MNNAMRRALISATALAVTLAGCAGYQPQPLDTTVALPTTVRLTVDPSRLPLPQLRHHRFDPGNGLDGDEVAMLAVADSPLLQVARDQAVEGRAQAFAAGLLPDPQLSGSSDHPTTGNGTTDAYGLGIAFDLGAFIQHGAAQETAQHEVRHADLGLLWQQWQVASEARLLCTRIVTLEQERTLLAAEQQLFAARQAHIHTAFTAGNLTADTATDALLALQGVQQRVVDLDRQIMERRHALNALLGLDPEVRLHLVAEPLPSPLPTAEVERELKQLAQRRADLLALQQGYAAQEARVRQAVLAQFPVIGIGFNHARDTGGIVTNGFALTLNLPLWNRSQGQIAVERATRRRLRDEFHQRLTEAYAQGRQLLDDGTLITRQLAQASGAAAQAEQTEHAAQTAFAAGNLEENRYLQLAAAAADKRLEALSLQQTLTEQRIGLSLLLGSAAPLDGTIK